VPSSDLLRSDAKVVKGRIPFDEQQRRHEAIITEPDNASKIHSPQNLALYTEQIQTPPVTHTNIKTLVLKLCLPLRNDPLIPATSISLTDFMTAVQASQCITGTVVSELVKHLSINRDSKLSP
jgi:hypothetical protein